MSGARFLRSVLLSMIACCLSSSYCLGSAFVRGAYYRLGEDDPGAVAGAIGNDPTQDSFGDDLDLARFGSPHYAADVPPRGPFGSKLSMQFANEGLGGPAFPAAYGRASSLSMVEQGYALEAWVKAGPTNLDSVSDSVSDWLVAYNGEPGASGFGLFLHGVDYVVRIGPAFERPLGPAEVGVWHHVAYVQSLGTSSYYYDGTLVAENDKDPLPLPASGGFWIGGRAPDAGDAIVHGFNGWIDEVRYQSFNPLAAGAFEPTAFLIVVPEPAAAGFASLLVGTALPRRRRCSRR